MTKSSVERIGITIAELENVSLTDDDRRKMYAITPMEGRYEKYVSGLHGLTSDFEWNRRRVWVEVEYLIALADFLSSSKTKYKKVIDRQFSKDELKVLRGLYENYSEKDYNQAKLIERKTNHDLVAIVRWIDYKLSLHGVNVEGAIHFGRTSADIDSNVYNSIVRDLVNQEYLPCILKVQEKLIENAKKWDIVFAGQTHGQWAEFTTLKKIMANFVDGIRQCLGGFYTGTEKVLPIGKLGGAIGNNSDLVGAYPDLDWEKFNKKFIEETLGLAYFPMADQDSFNIRNNEIFDAITRTNDVLIKFCEDFWEYCSRRVLVNKPKDHESGSSVMAHKSPNPWRIEGGWEYLSDVDFGKYHNLTKYKRQGDLRRSIRARTIGEPFAKCVIAMNRILEEVNLYSPNLDQIEREVNDNIAMSSAYIQTVLRREGKDDAYDVIKKISMGKKVDVEEYFGVLGKLAADREIPYHVADEVKNGLIPRNNIGNANKLADDAIILAEQQIKLIKKLIGDTDDKIKL